MPHVSVQAQPASGPPDLDAIALLSEAADHVAQGIVVVDSAMRVRFVNAAARLLWRLTDAQCGGDPVFSEFIYSIAEGGAYGIPQDELPGYVLARFDTVQRGDPKPIDILTSDGRTIRAQVTPLPSGGRMLTHVDVTDLVQQADHFRQLSKLDPLTGLANRRAFLELAQVEFQRFRRYHMPFSIGLADIDYFKSVNDEFGHDVGDRAILHVASLLAHCGRATDIVARLGGDEFSILMPHTSATDAMGFADRLRRAIEHFPLYLEGVPIRLTISIGIAEAEERIDCAESVVKMADERLYLAKRGGKNCCAGAD